ncbi:NUDIX hydrolase [Paenibacillus athensensis]|uniref:NUDIX hydrolase n=1 Tax=Paenibacillus athensensis TaxID=1967502 RepID=UPI001E4ED7AF|nr:NUDIX domain-containing protein [Paenibacillus athensensis]
MNKANQGEGSQAVADLELFDIYDSGGRWLGTAPRSQVHAQGFWHRTFQCWIVSRANGVPRLLLQLRHPDKDTFPDLLDISCAGHLQAGEDVADGARELEEELGLSVAFEQLWPCGVIAEEDVIGDLIDREFCHVFALICEQPLAAYTVQKGEVSGLFTVPLDAFRRLIAGEAEQIEAQGFVVDERGSRCSLERRIGRSELVPHPAAYYEMLFAGIDAMLALADAGA